MDVSLVLRPVMKIFLGMVNENGTLDTTSTGHVKITYYTDYELDSIPKRPRIMIIA